MMDGDDRFFITAMSIFLVFVLLLMTLLAFAEGCQAKQIEMKAIEAGLVQDSEGNWVKP